MASSAPILWIDDENGTIGKLDIATGTVNIVGPAGVVLTDMAFDSSGSLWGVTATNLYRIDKDTGGASLVGALGQVGVLNALVFGLDGILYAASDRLYGINTATGAASLIGPIGFASAGDLAFQNGTLFLATSGNQLATVNTATGAGKLVGPTGVAQVFGLAGTSDGTLLAVAGNSLYRLDPATGASTLLLSFAGQGLGTAYGAALFDTGGAGGGPTEVPEPALLFPAGLLMGGLWNSRLGKKPD